MSGIGHAAVHIAGLMAYFVSAIDNGDSSFDTIKTKILDMAVKDKLEGVPEGTASASQPWNANPYKPCCLLMAPLDLKT